MTEFQKLQFKPGINREQTSYTNTGGWYDADRVRFRSGVPEKIGGWSMYTEAAFSGICRLVLRHRTLAGTIYTLVCTNSHVYLEDGGVLNDITPWTTQDTGLSDPFTTTAASAEVQVTKSNHGRAVGDRIVISGASGFDGLAAGDLNGERVISEIVDTNNYKFTAGASASAGATGGGSPVTIQYILQEGLNDVIYGTGWGADPWGSGGWGEAGSNPVAGENSIRLWSADAYGEDLVISTSGSATGVFYWDATNGVTTRAFPLSELAGATDTPQNSVIVKVSDKDRHVLVFGGDPYEDPGVPDPLLIRWADQETAQIWTPSTTTTSGQILVTGGNEIIAVVKIRQQFLVWTDDTLHGLGYIGGVYTYGIETLARNTDIIGQNAATTHLGVAYWMGRRGFYRYDGQVTEIPCEVEDYVFNDIDLDSRDKVFASTNMLYNEIIWHYPSLSVGTGENDRYVVYNVSDGIWSIGTMTRSAWADVFLSQYPVAAGVDGFLYYHEFGNADGSVNPPVSLNAYITSSPVEIGDGYSMMYMDRFIPDVTFRNSNTVAPSLKATLTMYNSPGLAEHDSGSGSVARSATSPVEQYTDIVGIRLRGRSVVLKYEDDVITENADTTWRIGTPRIRIRTDGRR